MKTEQGQGWAGQAREQIEGMWTRTYASPHPPAKSIKYLLCFPRVPSPNPPPRPHPSLPRYPAQAFVPVPQARPQQTVWCDPSVPFSSLVPRGSKVEEMAAPKYERFLFTSESVGEGHPGTCARGPKGARWKRERARLGPRVGCAKSRAFQRAFRRANRGSAHVASLPEIQWTKAREARAQAA